MASQPALDKEMPGMPTLTPASSQKKPKVQVTTLENGLRVASEDSSSAVTALGMFVDAGSKYETDANSGVSHFLEHMAFKSTNNRSSLRIMRDIEDIGGQFGAASAREFAIYQGDFLREYSEEAVELLADTINNSKLAAWDMAEQRRTIGYELEDMEKSAQQLLTEMIHAAAYSDQGAYGRPLWCPSRNLDKLQPEDLRDFKDTHYTAPRMVLSAAGIEHEKLVELAKTHFGDLPSTAPNGKTPVENSTTYAGGERRVIGTSPLTHVALCFDAGGWSAPDLLDVCTLHMLLGGGGSFSAGGPGKGMYSRLYTNVLNKNHWVDSATAFNSMYNDGGLFGIYGTCEHQYAGNLVDVMTKELQAAASELPTDEETQRAKNQLKSSVLMKLESRQVLFEDMGRQILTFGKHESGADLCKRIDAVTPQSIQAAAAKALKSKVTVAAFGDVSKIPMYDAIASRFN